MLTGEEVTFCLCFSDDCLTVSENFDEHGGVMVWSETAGCEAHFCTAVSVAGDWGTLFDGVVSTAAEWPGLESGTAAGSLMAFC